jgi:hypothetical protein
MPAAADAAVDQGFGALVQVVMGALKHAQLALEPLDLESVVPEMVCYFSEAKILALLTQNLLIICRKVVKIDNNNRKNPSGDVKITNLDKFGRTVVKYNFSHFF